ncbi:hypothetical protein OQA88_10251 [Cercophora sp. LCS_1]
MGIPTIFCRDASGRSYFVGTGPLARMPITPTTSFVCLGTPFPAPTNPDSDSTLLAFKQLIQPPSHNIPMTEWPAIAHHRLATATPHRHITQYIGHCPQEAFLITESCPHGSLTRSQLRSKPQNFRLDLLRLLDNTLRALVHLHNTTKLAHLDMHPSNILVTGTSPNFVFKLANFTHSIPLGPHPMHFSYKQTLDTSYLAPELHPTARHPADHNLLDRADIYSLAWTVVCLILPTAATPTSPVELENLLIQAGEVFHLSKAEMGQDRLLTLLWQMLQPEPTGRLSAKDALVALWGLPPGSLLPTETLADEAVDYMNIDPVFSDANAPRDPKVLFPWIFGEVSTVTEVKKREVEEGIDGEEKEEEKEEKKEEKDGTIAEMEKHYKCCILAHPPCGRRDGKKDDKRGDDRNRGDRSKERYGKAPKKGMARDGWWYPDWLGPKPVPDWFANKKDTRRFPDRDRKKL